MTPTQEDREALINEIIAMYHTTRLRDTPAAQHILTKRSVLAAFSRLEERGARRALEAAAKACEDQAKSFLSPEYAQGQPLLSFQEWFACGQCATAIRQIDPASLGAE